LNNKLSAKERQYVGLVKSLPCSVCDAPGPSDAHHVKQHRQYTVVALCRDCHTGYNGWHGTKAFWRIRKLDELDALNITIERMVELLKS